MRFCAQISCSTSLSQQYGGLAPQETGLAAMMDRVGNQEQEHVAVLVARQLAALVEGTGLVLTAACESS